MHSKEVNMKACTICNEIKDLHQFDKYRNSRGVQVETPRCKACRREYVRKYNSNKKSKTGLTREEWLTSVRKPKLSFEQAQELAKQKWDAWYAENKEVIQEESRRKAEQERLDILSTGSRTCSKCNKELDLSQFTMRNRKRKDGSTYKMPYSHCKTCRRAYNRKYENTPTGKAYKKRNAALRDSRNRQATPKWLTSEQRKQIVDIYEHMRDCRAVTGEDYHVDHIVPLRGENICGLHVPWNLQVLPAYVNMSKSNTV